MRYLDGKTLLEFLVLCLFEIVIVIAILMVVGVLPWPLVNKGQNFDPMPAKEPPPAGFASQNAPAPAPTPAPVPKPQPAPEPASGDTAPALEPAALEPAPEPTPEPPPHLQAK